MNRLETFDGLNGRTPPAGWSDAHKCRVLVPIDLSSSTTKLLSYGESIAARFDAVVRVLHVVQLSIVGEERGVPREALLRGLAEDARRELYKLIARFWVSDLAVTIRVREGRPREAIVREALESNAGMIIMGARNRTGLPRLLRRSTLGWVIRNAPCPVLAVRLGNDAKPSFWAASQAEPEFAFG